MKVITSPTTKNLFREFIEKLEEISIEKWFDLMPVSEEILRYVAECLCGSEKWERHNVPPTIKINGKELGVYKYYVMKCKDKIVYIIDRIIVIENQEQEKFVFFRANDDDEWITDNFKKWIGETIVSHFLYEIKDIKGFDYTGEKILTGEQAAKLLNNFVDHIEQTYKDEKEFMLYFSLKGAMRELGYNLDWDFKINKIEIEVGDYSIQLERVIKGGMKTIIQEYARDNVGHDVPSEDLMGMAMVLQELLNTISYEEWFKLSDDEKLDLCYNYLIDEREYEEFNQDGTDIILVDDNELKIIDKCISNGASWGYQEVRIIIVDQETITDELRKVIKNIPDNSKWKCGIEYISYFLEEILDDFEIENEDIIDGKTLKELVEEICKALEGYYSEDDAILYGYESGRRPICSNNPYAWAGDSFAYEIDKDEITIRHYFTELSGAHYHLFKEEIYFLKQND